MRTQTDARDCLRYSAEESRLYKALKLAGTPVGVHLAMSRVNSAFPAMAAALDWALVWHTECVRGVPAAHAALELTHAWTCPSTAVAT